SFQVASQIDSRTVLDMMGAEKLLGMGDMLFLGGDLGKPQRIQGPFVPENEVKSVVKWLKSQGENEYDNAIVEPESSKQIYYDGRVDYGSEGTDALFEEAKDLILQTGKGSASLLQRRLKVGYARAARLLDELEAAGIVGPAEGSKPRDVLIEKHNIDNE
ncbi:MAG: DNA translocase FtsK, partial [Candidatus Paceibacterota bacterium]